MTEKERQEIIELVHKTLRGFFAPFPEGELGARPFTQAEKVLLEVNKALCNKIKEMSTEERPHRECEKESAIDYLTEIGWLPEHDRILTERPQWIPCSERLPEKSGRYIVTEKRFAIDDRKHNGRYQTVVEEVTFSNGIWNRANFIEVLAWMPLPTPYREEESHHDKNIL